jgi:hypothetical protein
MNRIAPRAPSVDTGAPEPDALLATGHSFEVAERSPLWGRWKGWHPATCRAAMRHDQRIIEGLKIAVKARTWREDLIYRFYRRSSLTRYDSGKAAGLRLDSASHG